MFLCGAECNLQVCRVRFEMKTANRSREELRFVTSAEQLAPYLEELQSDTSSSVGDADSMEHTDDDSTHYQLTVPVVLPPATSALATVAAIALPNIYEEYVNFIDLSVLNPIVAACDCQRDELIESEISERSIYANFLFSHDNLFYCPICAIKLAIFTIVAREFRAVLTNPNQRTSNEQPACRFRNNKNKYDRLQRWPTTSVAIDLPVRKADFECEKRENAMVET